MKRIPILSLISISCMGLAAFWGKRPNILWFVVDDMSANFFLLRGKRNRHPKCG